MKMATALLTLGLLLGASAPALSAATPEGAQRLTAVFQAYLGLEPGVVSVTPQGERYAARIDLAPLFAKVKDPTVKLSLSPLEWTLTEQGGGTWKVDQNQPLSFAFGVKDQGETIGSIASVTATGLFDEALGGFTTSSATLKTIAVEQNLQDGGSSSRMTHAVDTMTIETAMQGSPDSADVTSRYGFTGLKQQMSFPASADMPAMDVVITSPSGKQDAVVKGLKLRAISDLAVWLVANQNKDALIAGQATLKDKLRAALPLFTHLSGTGTLEQLTATSPFGPVAMKQLGFGAEMNGISAEGMLRETFSFSGLALPQNLLPPWAAGLVPEDFSIDLGISDFDLATPAALIIDKLDLSKPDPLPSDLDQPLLDALLPKGLVTITLGPSRLMAKLYDLSAQGSMTAGPVAPPSGQALLTLKGLDETMAVLQAGPPDVQQAAPALLMLKGLAKTEADGRLSWQIESKPDGSVTVNGADVSKLMGSGQQ